MIDQITISVGNLAASREFFEKALAPLQYQAVLSSAEQCGFSIMQKPDFWIQESGAVSPPVHVAFTCRNRATVEEFHAAAIAAGGDEDSVPGPRPDYHPNSYGASVRDPDGNTIEAVCHRPQ